MPRRVLEGVVVSNKADKTAVVRVERKEMHPVYKKYIKRHKRYAAHDPKNNCEIGQVVEIIEIAPVSKTKTWLIKKILKSSSGVVLEANEIKEEVGEVI